MKSISVDLKTRLMGSQQEQRAWYEIQLFVK